MKCVLKIFVTLFNKITQNFFTWNKD